jgi:hypothetical protein
MTTVDPSTSGRHALVSWLIWTAGALTGLVLGVAQTLALPSRTRYRGVWAVAVTLNVLLPVRSSTATADVNPAGATTLKDNP